MILEKFTIYENLIHLQYYIIVLQVAVSQFKNVYWVASKTPYQYHTNLYQL